MAYATGLVVGKFCPLHAGHEYVINTALDQCEKVIILSYTSKNFSGCEPEKRRVWLTQTFPTAIVVVLEPSEVPDDDLPADMHRLFCANHLLNKMSTTVQAVFTSEDYGDGFAEYLSKFFTKELRTEVKVDHILVDKDRIQFPTSGTALRANMQRAHLNHFVAKDFIPRVAFLGGESSGKTTLARELGFLTDMNWVAEYGRELYDERGGKLNYEDMEFIARHQIASEGSYYSRHYLFCDTTPLTTMFYSEQMFGRVAPALRKMAEREYHKIYLCDPNIDFEQDGTRRDATFRNVGHNWYVNYLTAHEIPYTIVSGTVEERVNFVMKDLGL
jgi:HTH-type transcriptional repressor of NAD biosynthesis genes